ncbi:MAG: AAA family ATPase [Bacilli bacterium]
MATLKGMDKFYQSFLESVEVSNTYPGGMKKFIRTLEDLSNGGSDTYWNEVIDFSNGGNSDVRYKISKELDGVDLDLFKNEVNYLLRCIEELDCSEFSIDESNLLYDKIKDNKAFNIVNKRIGNGIPNAVFTRIYSNDKLKEEQKESFNKVDTNFGITTNFFTMRCGKTNQYFDDFVNNRFIAITWDHLNDIRLLSDQELTQYGIDKYDSKLSGSMFKIFRDTMQVGDLVLLIRSGTKMVQLAVITSEMNYDATLPSCYSNYRTIEIIKEDCDLNFVYNVQSTITIIYDDKRKLEVRDNLDNESIIKYNNVMSNIDTNRVFKFKNFDDKPVEVKFLNNYKQLIIDGAPGTGKSYGLNLEVETDEINHERVTFYQDYEYHNFVGSILPKLNGTNVVYEFCKGPFTKLLNDSFNNPEEKHYLIIEELTRGNAAAIFGDIFQLLDRDENGWSMYPITNDNIFTALDDNVQEYLNSREHCKGKVVLPPNFSIICTINSSDQNVYPLDTAFKRRFDYKIKSTKPHDGFTDFEIQFGTMEAISWESFYQELNNFILINMGLKEDKQVGPYFIKSNDKNASIQTKLAMYMWNDLQKVHTMSNVKIFDESKVQTLYKVDELFITGSKEEILNILTTDFKKHFKLKG